jgi:very-short-patch-repair endonuclease
VYYLPYKEDLTKFSRHLRNNSTTGEILLWMKLRAGCMRGYSFNRQKPVGRYIVDFYCKPLQLVIEVDGGYHFEDAQKIKDEERQGIIESLGLKFLRFHEEQVKQDMPEVIRAIEDYIIAFEKGI